MDSKVILLDFDEAERFFRVLGTENSALFQVFATKGSGARVAVRPEWRLLPLEEAWAWLTALEAAGARPTIAASLNDVTGPRQTDVRQIRVIWADDDVPRDGPRSDWPIPPHIVSETSPGKFHYFWRIQSGALEPTEAGLLQRAIAERFGTDQTLADFAKKARLPGSCNWKNPAEPWVVKIVLEASHPPLTKTEVLDAFGPLTLDRPAKKTTPKKAGDDGKAEAGTIEKGARNSELFRRAIALHHAGEMPDAIREEVSSLNAAKCSPPLDEAEVQGIVDSATSYRRGISAEHWADAPLARRFVAFCGADGRFVRHCLTNQRWVVWAGGRWKMDESGELIADAYAAFAHDEREEAEKFRQARLIRAIPRRTALLEDFARRRAVLQMASTLPGVPIKLTDFDDNPRKIQVQGPKGPAVVDLEAGEARPSRPEDYCLRIAGEFAEGAGCPRFEAFLRQIFCNDSELIGYVPRVLGYSLTGLAREEVLHFWLGNGANGKSVLANAMRLVFGEYCKTAAPEIILSRGAGSTSNDLAALAGARLVLASEIRDGGSLDDQRAKALASNEEVNARFLYGEYFTFKPQLALHLLANHEPRTRVTDSGFWRRVRILPFRATFEGDARQIDFFERVLAPETRGILAWVVRGAVAYFAEGLGTASAVVQASRAYRDNSDLLRQWREDSLIEIPDWRTPTAELWRSFQAWHVTQFGEDAPTCITVRTLTRTICEAGFDEYRGAGERGFVGLRAEAGSGRQNAFRVAAGGRR